MKLIVFILLIVTLVMADEGMWMLTQLDQLDLDKKGLKIKIAEIYHPDNPSLTNAIVWLGGCSASFVSPNGLILTNHHCAYAGLQRASSERGQDYLDAGFLAQKKSDELPAPGMTAWVLKEMKDVTEIVLKAGKGVDDPVERDRRIDEKISQMEAELEGERDNLTVNIVAFYKGRQYWQFIFDKYEDLRVVYAPPSSIGVYGGEIDNWMWPRHTGDFTFMRVYSAPDGSAAKYNAENVPLKPKRYLKVAKSPLKEGDLTFVIGFPGSTTRWRTSNSAAWNLNRNYPERMKDFQEIIDLIEENTKDDPQGKIKAASMQRGLENTIKNYKGKIRGMKRKNLVDEKQAMERDLMSFINQNPRLKEKYGNVLVDATAQYDKLLENREKEQQLLFMQGLSGLLPSLAIQVYGIAREREKPDTERDPNFSERRILQNVERLKYRYLSYYEPVDKAMTVRMLNKVNTLAPDQRIKGFEYLFADNVQPIEQFMTEAYSKSKLSDPEFTKTLFDKSSAELTALGDPFIQMAANIYDELDAVEKKYETFGSHITELRKQYLNALYDWKGLGLYPDANGTIRFSYGPVRGYKPADAVTYKPFTTLKGVVEKNTGEDPFAMPEALGKLQAERDFGRWMDPNLKDVPVAFTHMCDITGGNSGSAVMNGNGELIGLAFDGNFEAMTGDWQYDYDIQRSISVDIRYVLFVTEKFAGADFILKEMGVPTSDKATSMK
jgi:hypothetical protein